MSFSKASGRSAVRRAAWPLSVLLHALLLALVLSPASGQFSPPAGAQRADMAVSLVTMSQLEAQAVATSDDGGLRPLFARFDTGQPPVAVDTTAPSGDLAKFMHRLQSQPHPAQTAANEDLARDRTSQARRALDNRTSETGATSPAGEGGSGRSGTPSGLWGAMESCWRSLPAHSSLPVTLDVTLDFEGRIAVPPKIIRVSGVPIDEPHLQAEAQALAALSACVPRGDVRFGGRTYRLEFGREGGPGRE
jgi:hypothetical protein